MLTNRRFPIGMQCFEEIISDNYLYVDKTKFIWELTDSGKFYFLSRPRRFGKSLFLSTLEAYFEGKRDIFDGLFIQELEDKKPNAWEEHPVIYFDFTTGVYNDDESISNKLDKLLGKYETVYGNKESGDVSIRFESLIRKAYEKTQKKVVVLIDEYDKPLLETMFSDEKTINDCRKIMRSFYSAIKASDKYLKFVFIAGITKFSKLNVFSGLNNLNDISNDPEYSEICGITKDEMENNFRDDIIILSNKEFNSYDETINALEKKYNGYRFSEIKNSVYNPYSLLNALKKKNLDNYWHASGTPSYLVELIKKSSIEIPKLESDIKIYKDSLDNYRIESKNPIPVMFQAGYLTIKDYDKEFGKYILGFPNNEVRYTFLNFLIADYMKADTDETSEIVEKLITSMKQCDVDTLMDTIKSTLSSIPYDSFYGKNLPLREHNYQVAVYIMLKLTGELVQTEVHCSTGRADCVVQTDKYIYIFEFKLSNTTAKEALDQIKERNYAGQFISDGKKIISIGMAFDEKDRTLKEWKMEEINF